jgi:hypothetical protein
MTSKERMRAAMAGVVPDRVPLMCQMSIGHMLLLTRSSPVAFWNSAEVYAEGLLGLRRAHRFDGILVSLHGHAPDWEKKVSRVETVGRAQIVTWKNGDRTVFPGDDLPLHHPARPRPPLSFSAFDTGSLPEEVSFIPVSQGLDFGFAPGHLYDAVDIVVEKAGPEFSVHGEVTSPFDYFLRLFDFSEALLGLIAEPSKAKDILRRLTAGVSRIASGLVDRGVDAVKVSSPYAGSGFISPSFYREFVLPFESQVARAVTSHGVPAYVHTCGKISDRLEMMMEAGFTGVECLDPPPLGDVELADAKRRVGGAGFIKGNIDPVHVLLAGTPAAVRQAARQTLETGKRGGRFILSTACSIAPRTRKENIQILSEVVEEGGYYASR